MKNAIRLFCFIALVSAIGFGMTSCDNGSTGGGKDALTGTWIGQTPNTDGMELVAANGSFTLSKDGHPVIRGTYKVSGNTATITFTHVNTGAGGAVEWTPYDDIPEGTEGLPPAKVMEGTISGNQFEVMGEVFIKQGSGDSGGPGGGPVTPPPPPPPPPSGGTLTITGIPTDYNGKYAFFMCPGSSDDGDFQQEVEVQGAQAINMETGVITLVQISNGRVSIPTWIMNTSGNVVRYSGSDTVLEVFVVISNSSSITFDDNPNDDVVRYYDSITFSSGSATRTWAEGADGSAGAGGGEDALTGTWIGQSDNTEGWEFVAANGSFTVNNNDGHPVMRGTYQVSGNTATITFTHVNTGYLAGGADAWTPYDDIPEETEGLPPAKVMDGTISGNQFDVMGAVFIKQGSS